MLTIPTGCYLGSGKEDGRSRNQPKNWYIECIYIYIHRDRAHQARLCLFRTLAGVPYSKIDEDTVHDISIYMFDNKCARTSQQSQQ